MRPWRFDDLENLVKLGNNPRIAEFMMDAFPHPYTIEAGKLFIENANKPNPINIFAIDVEGMAVGGIGVHPQQDIMRMNMELGYWLGEPYWGKGITTQAIKLILDYAFKNFDVTRIYARPFGTNIASQRVLEKAGFLLEAKMENIFYKNGIYLDELHYAVRKKH